MKKATPTKRVPKKPKLPLTESRMLLLIEILKDKGTIRFTQDFCDTIGIHKQTLTNIKRGETNNRFASWHILEACKTYNVNANWLFGLEDDIFRSDRRVLIKKAPVKKKSEVLN